MSSILPGDDKISVTPEDILRYLNPDGLRMMFRQERLRWNLKPNKDSDYYSNTTLFKYSGDLHNEGDHQRMDVRVFPDNGANPGYAGVYTNGGEEPMVNDHDKWDDAMSDESKESIVNRVEIGAHAKHVNDDPIEGKTEHRIAKIKNGHGMNHEKGEIEEYSNEREAYSVYDPYDGRAYLLSNDDAHYVNNKDRDPERKIPGRAHARIIDIPTDMNDLDNTSHMVSDWNYQHTDENFDTSEKFILDNIDDRTFVYPEISKDSDGNWIENRIMGLEGVFDYREGDGTDDANTEINAADRNGEAANSINGHKKTNDSLPGNDYNNAGYFPGIFRSLEELEKVDLLGQLRDELTHTSAPGGRRRHNFYQFDGSWYHDQFHPAQIPEAFDAPNQLINDMETIPGDCRPIPFKQFMQTADKYSTNKLYQWRYNRVMTWWYSTNLEIMIHEPGMHYKVGDILRYNFMNRWIYYRVDTIDNDVDGRIISGHYIRPDDPDRLSNMDVCIKFPYNPSTNGMPVIFKNRTSTGRGAKFIISCPATIEITPTQLKNNLYAYVDVVPTVRSVNTDSYSDNDKLGESPMVTYRSTAPTPGYTGVNRGKGGSDADPNNSDSPLYEHGGNATAGAHVHLFRYVIDTSGNSFETVNGIKVYTGKWVDQGPLGVERPCDIKALYLSNHDTNNFNNYYKFMLDIIIDSYNREGDFSKSENANTISSAYIHVSDKDPWEQPIGETLEEGPSQYVYKYYKDKKYDIELLNPISASGILDHQAFFRKTVNPTNNKVTVKEITHKVVYINAATRVAFIYNPTVKKDSTYGYGAEGIGWFPIAGTIQK